MRFYKKKNSDGKCTAILSDSYQYSDLCCLGIDKWRPTSGRLLPTGRKKAKQGSWRISEATLLMLAVIGGTIGALFGMQVWRHKTMHLKFKYGLPLILFAQIALMYLISEK